MIQITIFNYEAFYLDFLEGNLNEANSALLLDFLKDHPELVVDELPVYQSESVELESSFLDSLKHVDLENDGLTSFNCESFIIAYFENQLSKQKEFELAEFVQVDNKAKRLFENYRNIKLQADFSVYYPNKSELKKSKRIVFWPYISAAASVLVIFGVYTFINQKENLADQNGLAAFHFSLLPIQNVDVPNGQKSDVDVISIQSDSFDGANSLAEFVPKNQVVAPNQPKNIISFDVASISKKDLFDEKSNAEVQPNKVFPIHTLKIPSENEAVYAANEMKNPIKPVTERLSDFTKTEIDLKTANAVEKGKKGFYIKIGNLEVERKKH